MSNSPIIANIMQLRLIDKPQQEVHGYAKSDNPQIIIVFISKHKKGYPQHLLTNKFQFILFLDQVTMSNRTFNQSFQPHQFAIIQKAGQNVIMALDLIIRRINNQNLKNVDQDQIFFLRNSFKIVLFITFWFINCTVIKKQKSSNQLLKDDNKKKKKKKGYSKLSDFGQYASAIADLNAEIVFLLSQTLKINFEYLWQLEPIDTQLINYYGDACAKVLQNKHFWEKQVTKQSLIKVLEKCIEKQTVYKIIKKNLMDNLIQQEQNIDVLVDFFYRVDQQTHPISRLTREFLFQLINFLLGKTKISAQTNLFRNSSKFLISLCQKLPNLFYNNMALFIHLYDCESHFMRNAATEIIVKIMQNNRREEQDSQKNNDRLLEIILQRVYDQNALCRAHSLFSCIQLIRMNLFPLSYLSKLLITSADRIKDVSSKVRRKSIELFKFVLNVYLYRFGLKENKFMELQEVKEEIRIIDEQNKQLQQCIKRTLDLLGKVENNQQHLQLESQLTLYQQKQKSLLQNSQILNSYKSMLQLLTQIIDCFVNLLGSKNQTDVLQTILLFQFLHKSGLSFAAVGIKKMLVLIYSKQKKVKEEVIRCFISLYLSKSVQQTFENLENMFSQGSNQQQSCLQELLQCIKQNEKEYTDKIISDNFLKLTWNKFITSIKNNQPNKGRIPLKILRITISQLNQAWIISLQGVVKKFNQSGTDFIILKQIAHIVRLAKLDQQHSKKFLFLLVFCLTGQFGSMNREWYMAAQQVLFCVFARSVCPQKFCEFILKKGIEKTNLLGNNEQDVGKQSALAQLIYLLGHCSLKMLIHIDQIENKLKFIRKNKEKEETEQIEQVVGGVQAIYQSKIQQLKIFTQNMIYKGVISHFLPIIQAIVQRIKNSKSMNSQLERISVLTMCKFMCVSDRYCVQHLKLIFDILNMRLIDPIIKNNIIISMGDLLHRFPNNIQPYSREFLHDEQPRVRKTTLMVLTHLILNDMIKIKSEICDIAVMIDDPNPQVQNLVSLFFYQLNNKDSKLIFNIIPQAITRLSQKKLPSGIPIKEQTFQIFARKILSIVDKEKYSQGLIEKLCQRFVKEQNVLDWRNTSLCIFLLAKVINQKSLRKLIEMYDEYRPHLRDEIILANFKNLIGELKKKKKTELRPLVDELQAKIQSHKQQNFNLENARKNRDKLKKNKRTRGKKGVKQKANEQMFNQQEQSIKEEQPMYNLRRRNLSNQKIYIISQED